MAEGNGGQRGVAGLVVVAVVARRVELRLIELEIELSVAVLHLRADDGVDVAVRETGRVEEVHVYVCGVSVGEVHGGRLRAGTGAVGVRGCGEADLEGVRPAPRGGETCRAGDVGGRDGGCTATGSDGDRVVLLSDVFFVGRGMHGEGGRDGGVSGGEAVPHDHGGSPGGGRRSSCSNSSGHRLGVIRVGETGATGIAGRIDRRVIEGEDGVWTLGDLSKPGGVEGGEGGRGAHAIPPRREVELGKHVEASGRVETVLW